MADLIDSFAKAPVDNPDGKTGINLHIDAGKNVVMRTDTGEPWGARSQADKVPYQTQLGTTDVGLDGKEHYMTADAEAIRTSNFKRRGVFHYALLANLLGGAYSADVAGIAWDDNLVIAEALQGSSEEISATLMHELGHHFDLKHGGDSSEPNHEPNYLVPARKHLNPMKIIIKPIVSCHEEVKMVSRKS